MGRPRRHQRPHLEPAMTTRTNTNASILRNRQRLTIAEANNEPCARCGQPIDYTLDRRTRWGATADHINPLAHGHPELVPLDQLAPAHHTCNSKHGSTIGHQIRWRKGKTPTVVTQRDDKAGPVSSHRHTPTPMPVGPIKAGTPPMHPDHFPLPRVMTPERPGTDHVLSEAVLAWIDEHAPGPPLLPWQRYVVWRGFETQGGRLWRHVAFLVSRQQGKTFLMQRVMLARLQLAGLFGARRRC